MEKKLLTDQILITESIESNPIEVIMETPLFKDIDLNYLEISIRTTFGFS